MWVIIMNNETSLNSAEKEVKSRFKWNNLGDLAKGRSILGVNMPVLVYRLFQYTLRDVLSGEYGEDKASGLFKAAGHRAGIEFTNNTLDLSGDFDYFLANLQYLLNDLKIGILRVEQANMETHEFTLTIAEDLDCSGLPVTDDTICDYDEGFIAGILETYFGKPFHVKEVDCWANGARTCRFTACLSK
jgi:predicted hydrocarbon binding protein